MRCVLRPLGRAVQESPSHVGCLSDIGCMLGYWNGSAHFPKSRQVQFLTTSQQKHPSFKELGLPQELLESLQYAFPAVQQPTEAQAALIKAILGTGTSQSHRARRPSKPPANVILRDVTGSGKSLALLLALLGYPGLRTATRTQQPGTPNRSPHTRTHVEQLLIVPHTELARQCESWMHRIGSVDPHRQTSSPPSTLVTLQKGTPSVMRATQVIYRQCEEPLHAGARFLIATPQAIVDHIDRLSFDKLHTIALDEPDEMLRLPNRFHTHKEEVKWRRHPPLLLSVMDSILASTSRSQIKASAKSPYSKQADQPMSPRVIAISASANSVFRDFLARRSGWFKAPAETVTSNPSTTDWYDFASTPLSDAEVDGHGPNEESLARVAKGLMPQAEIGHYVARVDHEGRVNATSQPPSSKTSSLKGFQEAERYLLATAALFAEYRVGRGLLLISSGQSMQATLDFLNDLAVPALPVAEAFHLHNQSHEEESKDDAVLYVASVDAMRGLDIPGLEWVYIMPATKIQHDAKDYMHVAGRVGRLINSSGGRSGGNIVSLVDAADQEQTRKLSNTWRLLGLSGSSLDMREEVRHEPEVEAVEAVEAVEEKH